MPNFAYHSWMRDGDMLSAVTYCPSTITVPVADSCVTIEENTCYPFENTVRFRISADAPTVFTLVLRQPEWAVSTELTVNGKAVADPFTNGMCYLRREFHSGDEIVLTFTDEIRLIENAKGISIKKGALLYALPIREEEIIEGLRELGNPDFPHYSLYPDSKWNYAIRSADAATYRFHPGTVGSEPWRRSDNGLSIRVTGYELENWKLQHVKRVQSRIRPRVPCRWEDREAVFTPKVRPIRNDDPIGRSEAIDLVPYCTTRLRIAIFPHITK
jgi:hypothetical protein